MAELVLLHPRVGDMDALRTSPALPLGLLHAASLVAQEFETRLIDSRLDPDWRKSLERAVGPETLAICFTAFTGPMILSNLEMAARARRVTGAPLVWGGIHPSLETETTISDPLVDIVVRGEGEHVLLSLARALSKRQSLDTIRGIWYKENGDVRRNPDADLLDLDTLPEIPYHLVDVNRYMPRYRGRKSLYFQSSRGCHHACTYCFNTRFNRQRFRAQGAERTLERVRLIVEKYGAEDIYFVDDNFFVNLARDRAILTGMKKIGVTWQIQGVDIIALSHMDDDFLRLLQDSGLSRLTVGIESGSPRIRKLMKKAGAISDIETVMRRLANHNMLVFASFLAAIPTETPEELKQTTDLLLKLLKINPNLRNSPIYNYTPYPGTAMFELAVAEGYRPPKTLEEWGKVGSWDMFSWQDRPGRKLHEALYFVSNFLDRKTQEYEVPALVQLLSDAYRPIARWRVKRLNFDFLIEKLVADWATRLLERKIAKKRMNEC